MLRAVGLLGIVISCGLTGIAKCARLGMRKRLLEDFLEMTLDLKGKINYFRRPLTELSGEESEKRDTAAFKLLAALGDDLREKDGEIDEIWLKRAEEIYAGLPLTREDMEAVKYLGHFIGQTDYENHLFHFRYVEEKLHAQLEDAERAVRVKGPLYRKVGFFAGAAIAIALI